MTICPKCWEEKDIILWEYLWASDWCLSLECKKCNKQFHLVTWLEILKEEQWKNYWPMYFLLEWRKQYINQYPYDRPTPEVDKIFNELILF